mmetsp:Transcript_9987/g.26488  ORF Transcript_9987/g.26488 Transcript_9987/m.26488 type:complete len:200 (+) Transcript_9987:1075-1674(+)
MSLNVTKQLTGFPGKAKTRRRCPFAIGTVAKVVGFPGFMHISPKCTVPSSDKSCFMWSLLPRLTPPDVTKTSAEANAFVMRARNASGSSFTIPRSTTSPPHSLTSARNMGRLQSTTWPRRSSRAAESPTSTSSSPVDNNATCGRAWTSTVAKPNAASTPSSPAPTWNPRRSTTSPWAVSEPTCRMLAPGLLATLIRMAS